MRLSFLEICRIFSCLQCLKCHSNVFECGSFFGPAGTHSVRSCSLKTHELQFWESFVNYLVNAFPTVFLFSLSGIPIIQMKLFSGFFFLRLLFSALGHFALLSERFFSTGFSISSVEFLIYATIILIPKNNLCFLNIVFM